MARPIDGDTLIAWIRGSQQMTSKMKSIICYIKTMPTIDAVYVCDRKKCERCNPMCDFTRDIEHAGSTDKVFIIDNVTRWIPYPQQTEREGE